jgi:predicted transcriptional regulator YdeE
MKNLKSFFRAFFVSAIFFSFKLFSENLNSGQVMQDYLLQEQNQKLIVGIAIETNNQEASETLPNLWKKFMQEKIFDKISNKTNNYIYAVYTDYQGDYTKPYTYIIGCEVSSFDNISKGLVTKVIPASKYAVYSSDGQYPESLLSTWQKIWKSGLKRAYKTDLEIYPPDFHPINNPKVKVYISL